MAFKGIYRKGSWVFVENERGERDIMMKDEYEAGSLWPSYDALPTQDEWHINVLAHRPGEPN